MTSPPSPARVNIRARYDHRRQIVLDHAAREFATRGFHATTLQDLVTATGLTSGGLYHYFSSKDELLVMICDELMEPLLAHVHKLVASEDLSEYQKLQEIVRAWMRHIESHRYYVLVFQQERHVLERGPQWRRVRRQRKDFEELLAGALERAQQEGGVHVGDIGLALRALLGMVNHTAQWFRPGGRLTADEIADGYLRLLR